MRLSEVKNVLENMLDENNQIILAYDDLYSGGVKRIKNFQVLYKFLLVMKEIGPDIANFPILIKVLDDKNGGSNILDIDANDFNSLNSYVSQSTPKAIELYNLVGSLLNLQGEQHIKQPPQLINIKLPDTGIRNLKDLNDFNDRIEKLLKKFKIDGNIEFVGFDTGSKWYKILVGGHITYIALLGGLDMAQKAVDLRKSYYESGSAKIEYMAAQKVLNKESKITEKSIDTYISNKIDIYIENELKERLEEISTEYNGKGKEEFYTQMLIATKGLMKEISEEGTEFHLSLNPPEFAKNIGGQLEIDYKIGISELKTSEVKELPEAENEVIKDESSEEK